MANTQSIADLLNTLPALDEPTVTEDGKKETRDAGKMTGPAWPAAGRIYDQILAAGPAGINALLDLIKETDNGQDYKARYTLHALCTYCARPDKSAQRAMLVEALAGQLAGRPKPVAGLIVRELQWIGDRRAAAALGKALVDPDLNAEAANALLSIRDGAAEQFRAALPNTMGRAKWTVVQALGTLKDAPSAAALRPLVTDADVELRMAAVWSLANIADPSAVELLLKAADAKGYERAAATDACLLLAQNLNAAGRRTEARRIYDHLRATRTDPKEQHIRDAADAALAG